MDEPWVLFKCSIGSREHFMAWCRPNREGPGFDDIFYTELDGQTAWSPSGDRLPSLGELIGVIPFPPTYTGGAPDGARFPDPVEGDGDVVRETQSSPEPVADEAAVGGT